MKSINIVRDYKYNKVHVCYQRGNWKTFVHFLSQAKHRRGTIQATVQQVKEKPSRISATALSFKFHLKEVPGVGAHSKAWVCRKWEGFFLREHVWWVGIQAIFEDRNKRFTVDQKPIPLKSE